MIEGHHTLRLPDGRRIGYAVFGDARGHPVLYSHGFPSSRLEARLMEAAARRLSVAIIAPDRPGFGLSDFQPRRRIVDWPEDAVQLVEALGIERLSLLGGSGGCPYALACARRLGERLVRVGIVAGVAPAVEGRLVRRMSLAARTGFVLARQAPRTFDAVYGGLGAVVAKFPDVLLLLNEATPPDKSTLEDPDVQAILRASTREAFRSGKAGPVHELRLLSHRWGFELGAVEADVILWHGREDGVVPDKMGRYLAANIPAADLRLLPGEGHISLPVRRGDDILSELLP